MPKPVTIDQLWRGASSQPPWKRLPGQVDDAVNCKLDIAQGAVNRWPTRLPASGNLVYSQVVDEDGNEVMAGGGDVAAVDLYWTSVRDLVIGIQSNRLSAWKDDGTAVQVVLWNVSDFSYLPGTPSENIVTASGVDTVVMASRVKKLGYLRSWSFRQCYNYIKYGNPNPPGVGGGNGDALAPHVETAILGWDNSIDPLFTPRDREVVGEGNLHVVEFHDDLDPRDDLKNDGTVVFVKYDQDLEPRGWYIYYSGDPYPARDSGAPDSLVLNDADALFPEAANWYRVPDGRGPSTDRVPLSGNDDGSGQVQSGNNNPRDDDNAAAKARLDPDRWPVRLVYDEDAGKLYYGPAPWKQRLSGTNQTNAVPTITSQQKISDVAFFQSRLMMTAQTSLVSSRTSDFFNLYLDNVNQIKDDDRIDLAVAFYNVGRPLRLVECGQRLMILCDAGQIDFGSGDEALTNANGRMRVVTRFKTLDVRAGAGPDTCAILDYYRNVYRYSYINSEAGVQLAGHLNVHDVLRLRDKTPIGIFQVNRLIYIPDDGGDTDIHESFFVSGEEVQTAWGSVTTRGSILYADEWQDKHRWIVEDSEGYSLVHYSHDEVPPPADAVFWPRLDRLERVSGTYDAETKRTTFYHTGRDGDLATSQVVLVDDDQMHVVLTPVEIASDGGVEIRGKHDAVARTPYIGFRIDSELSLTKLYMGPSARQVMSKSMSVFHDRATNYEIEMVYPNQDTYTAEWTNDVADVTELDTPTLATGFSQHLVVGDLRYATLKLKHTGPGQVFWSAVEYELNEGRPHV